MQRNRDVFAELKAIGKPKDRDIYDELGVNATQGQPGMLQQLASSPITQFALGAGEAVQRPFYQAGNIINKSDRSSRSTNCSSGRSK